MSGVAAIAFVAAACGGGGSGPNPPAGISVNFGSIPSTVTAGTTAPFTALVTGDSANAGVTWSATCGTSSCGSFNPATTPSGTATTYTAPANVPTGGTVTVMATSVTDGTATASTIITISAPAGVSVAFAQTPPAALTINNTFPLTAVVTGDSKNGGVTWTVTCGTAACGTLNPTTTASNVATTYTAPAAIPTLNTVKVTATSVSDTTKSVSAMINIVGPALADGTYVYDGSGIDGNGALYYAGAFTVVNGSITGGEHDYIDQGQAGVQDLILAAGSSITTQPSGSVEIIITTNDNTFGDGGTFTLRGAKVSGTRMQLTEYDDFATATGTLDLQTGKAAPTGGYAFQISGFDAGSSTTAPAPLGVGGVLRFNGTTNLDTANSVFSYNDGGNINQGQSFTSGSITAPDSFGRVAISLTPTGASGAGPIGMIGYITGPNRIQVIEDVNDQSGSTTGGTAFGQGANTGTFSVGNVGGSVYVFSAIGEDSGGLTMAGGLQLNSNLTVQGNISYSDLQNNVSNDVTGSWTVSPNGRVVVSNIQPGIQGAGTPLVFEFYIDGSGHGVELGLDTSEVTAGTAYEQANGVGINPGNYAIGAFGFFVDANNNTQLDPWSAVGPLTISGPTLNGFTDYNANGTVTPDVTLIGTIDTNLGQVAIEGLDVNNTTSPDSYGYYPIDGSRTILIELDGNQLGIALLETVTP